MFFGENEVVVTLPNIHDMGSAQRGRSCNIVKMLLENGPSSVRSIAKYLMLDLARTRIVINTMVKDGQVFTIQTEDDKIVYLTDKDSWIENTKD